MKLQKIKIVNFKCFEGVFELDFNDDVNIIVGDNEAGKSTILEAIHITLTGMFCGRNIAGEVSQYLFNSNVVASYLKSIEEHTPIQPPFIHIEIYFKGDDEELALCLGDGNDSKEKASGIVLKIAFDEKYKEEYETLIKTGEVKSLPIEYYTVSWSNFSRKDITIRSIPIKSSMIDSSNYRYQNGSDVYISRIIRDNLEQQDIINISQAHRRMRDSFMRDESVKAINKKINNDKNLSDKLIQISVELSTKNAWESSLITELDNTPFNYVGKGTQCIVKTELALSSNKAKDAGIILLEEPENHLSHTNLNRLISCIKDKFGDKQIIITTHSSFVANKLGLDRLILLNNKETVRFNNLKEDTKKFFEKISGYDTLRFLLCNKAILVEGDSDELVIQKAFMLQNDGHLPIERGIDVISVGIAFLRFLEIAIKLKKQTTVVTDNDGSIDAIETKYSNYLGANKKDFIKICYDLVVDTGSLKIGSADYNYNTLEPKILKANNLQVINTVFGTNYSNEDDLRKYMKHNKTECALAIFETNQTINFPNYIMEAIKNEE